MLNFQDIDLKFSPLILTIPHDTCKSVFQKKISSRLHKSVANLYGPTFANESEILFFVCASFKNSWTDLANFFFNVSNSSNQVFRERKIRRITWKIRKLRKSENAFSYEEGNPSECLFLSVSCPKNWEVKNLLKFLHDIICWVR